MVVQGFLLQTTSPLLLLLLPLASTTATATQLLFYPLLLQSFEFQVTWEITRGMYFQVQMVSGGLGGERLCITTLPPVCVMRESPGLLSASSAPHYPINKAQSDDCDGRLLLAGSLTTRTALFLCLSVALSVALSLWCAAGGEMEQGFWDKREIDGDGESVKGRP